MISIVFFFISTGYDKQTKLRRVKIYFATPTFDQIIKDEKANFETKLSAIGGTMGLLTGFSLISGVEIVYYFMKFLAGVVMHREEKKSI